MQILAALVLVPLLYLQAAVLPPRWGDPARNPCVARQGGWQLIYWPGDSKCYRIFQLGPPCPETMELSPGPNGEAQCTCPPGMAQKGNEGPCYKLFSRGPCPRGQYFAPKPSNNSSRRGSCKAPGQCPEAALVFWVRDGHCYPLLTRGPCPKGELLIRGPEGWGHCTCNAEGVLEQHYWAVGDSCYQHYTRGPCPERGTLFLPGGCCGCHGGLPHYHNETGLCYEIGEQGPCASGHLFLGLEGCRCKPHYVRWAGDGACYRIYTQGPCAGGHLLVNSTHCMPLPCRRGRLYFPEEGNPCHRVGTRGPCPRGQLVLFESSVRPSVEGVSYRGACGRGDEVVRRCPAGEVRWKGGRCEALYKGRPCRPGQWLVPGRGGGEEAAKCECRPGHRPTETGQCEAPTVALARFLNQRASRELQPGP